MSIDNKVYGNGNHVYAIGGIPVGHDTAAPPPPPPSSEKILWLVTDNSSGPISARALVNGTELTSWSSTGGSASASVMLGSGSTLNVYVTSQRPEGYSSDFSAAGFSSTAMSYTTSSQVMIYKMGYDDDSSAIVSSHYSAASMVVTGYGKFFERASTSTLPDPYSGMNEICFGPMMIDASQASHPAGNIAFKYNDTATGWNSLYAAYNRGLDVSAFSALNLTASSDISAKQGDDPRGYVSISLRQRRNDAGIAWHEIEEKQLSGNKVSAVSVSGAASTGKIVATSDKYWDEPWVRIIGFWDESGTILNRTFYNDWQFSGVLR